MIQNISFCQSESFWEKTHLGLGVGVNTLGGEGGFQYKKYPAFQSYLAYEMTNHIILRGQLFYTNAGGSSEGLGYVPSWENNGEIGKIVNSGSEPTGTTVLPYQFKSRIEELGIIPEYDFFDITTGERKFTPYVFTGLNFYHYNRYFIFPKGYIDPITGKAIKSENGGIFLPDGVQTDPKGSSHSSTMYNIPVGFGIKYAPTKFIGLYAEFSRRILFTDYIDGYGSTALYDNNSNDYYYPIMIGVNFRLAGFETSLFRKHPKLDTGPKEKRTNYAKKGCPPVYL
ncbi:DUF6089 family protein [Rhizosphaericola mali]|uniref:DUF6089 domain-containing protein n=1 Tax=Rhizosphaericola mali TaxID=2545455 RepID=A0A5P2FZX3_9BACT|nr:DUF6089 family protein [Rhizosphaericola mali]QES87958.1 hypothetical protein E0W69_004515 [Rhizosphaericola mali]